MNKYDADILKQLLKRRYTNQRDLSNSTKHSLGIVNKSIKSLVSQGLLGYEYDITNKGKKYIEKTSPKRAIILAAGLGTRMAPINTFKPKALLEVKGETLIERLIKQLKEVNINDITVVVGFMKDSFEYLIDEYDVKLVYNKDYLTKNNLESLSIIKEKIDNVYIIPSHLYCKKNPFNKYEVDSWYMVSDKHDDNSDVRIDKKQRLMKSKGGNKMVGIAYISNDINKTLISNLNKLKSSKDNDDANWEAALFDNKLVIANPKLIRDDEIFSINSYEELREIDSNSNNLNSDAIKLIEKEFECSNKDIKNISVLKKGMTNRSFLFEVRNKKYIMRIPGEGTDSLINRKEEAEVYKVIKGLGLCDDPIYINPKNGYKITKYIEGVRVCDIDNDDDLIKCMFKLHSFHNLKLKVKHEFDLYEKIDYYESLWNGNSSIYKDYKQTKKNVIELKSYVDKHKNKYQLTHIDAVPDNFLFNPNKKGNMSLQLTDWEYSAMQDKDVDIAMFCIYSLYDKKQIDKLIDIYFKQDGGCDIKTRIKIYCYIAICGLLWSNWCEYKRNLGVEFGEYSLAQYRYAKDYYKLATELMKGIKNV